MTPLLRVLAGAALLALPGLAAELLRLPFGWSLGLGLAGGAAGLALLLALPRELREAAQTRSRLEKIIGNADVGLAVTELDGRLAEVNTRYAEIVGRPREALLKLRFQDYTHPADLGRDLDEYAALLAGHIERFRLEKRYLREDGSQVWALLTVALLRDAEGRPAQTIATVQDVSALKQAQDSLQAQRRQLQQIIHSIPDCVAVRDLHGHYELINPAALRLMSGSASEMIGRRPEEIYPVEQAAAILQADREAIDQGRTVRRESSFPDPAGGPPARVDMAISPLLGSAGHPVGVISVGRDVTVEHRNRRLLEQAHQRNHDLLQDAERSRLALLSLLEDQRQAQDRLAASEARLRALLGAIPDIIFAFDADGRLLDLLAGDGQLLIGPREAFLGKHLEDYLPAKLAALARQRIAAALDSGEIQLLEYPLTLGEREHWFEMRLAATGARTVLAISRDITTQREDRAAVQRSEASLRLAVEGSGDGLWDWDLSTGQIAFGGAFERLLRYEGQDFAQAFRFRERLHPEDRERAVSAVRAAIERGLPFHATYRLQCYDGEYRWFQGRGMCHRDEQGVPMHFAGVLTDLSERLRAEERQRLAAQVLDSTQEGVMITDARRRIISVNRAFTTVLGWSEAEVLGQSPRMLSSGRHDMAFYDAMWDEIARTGQWKGEIWNRRKDGELIPELLAISTVRDPQGQISHYVGVFADITGLKATEQRLTHLANHDPLTGLPNRLHFGFQLERALSLAQREGRRLAVLLLDLDRFKDVNDSYGHLVGDELLRHVAARLTARLRQSDLLARLGGDEFALLMHDLRHDEDAARLAAELLEALNQPWRSSEGVEVGIGVSIGICIYPDHGRSSHALLQGADAALYRAKGDGRGVYRYYADEMTQSARERLLLESRLRRALTENQLLLHYQPQVDLRSGRIVGAEALVRWQDPEHGLIPPGRFIPVAEATGLIGDIGHWVLREACRQGQAWAATGLPALTMAVNVSPRQFRHVDLAAQVMQVLTDSGLPPAQLELELTEGALMEREHEALQMLQRLRGMGVGIAIDDFGTGYSSLAYLKRFPIDVLKIDRSFIADIPDDPDDMEIAAAVIAMGHSLGIRVLAEGVETIDQLAFLRFKHCDRYQGFLCSKALPAPEFEALVRSNSQMFSGAAATVV